MDSILFPFLGGFGLGVAASRRFQWLMLFANRLLFLFLIGQGRDALYGFCSKDISLCVGANALQERCIQSGNLANKRNVLVCGRSPVKLYQSPFSCLLI